MQLKYDKTPDNLKNTVPYLDNKQQIVDEKKAKEVEKQLSSLRAFELLDQKKLRKMPLNLQTLQDIHKYLFGDFYPWAGQIRSVTITKGHSMFYPAEFLYNGIDEYFNNLKKDNFLVGLDEVEFVELFSYYSNELNILHPFREGNGRSKRIFLQELARRAGYDLNFDNINYFDFKQAEIEAFGDIMEGKSPNLLKLKVLYRSVIRQNKNLHYKEINTVEERINRFMWIYDRESSANWMSANTSVYGGAEKVKQLLQSQNGRNKLCEIIERTTYGAKPKSVRIEAEKYIDYIKSLSLAKDDSYEP